MENEVITRFAICMVQSARKSSFNRVLICSFILTINSPHTCIPGLGCRLSAWYLQNSIKQNLLLLIYDYAWFCYFTAFTTHLRSACSCCLHVASCNNLVVPIRTATNRMQAREISDFWHRYHYSMFSIDPPPQLNPYWKNMVFHVKHQISLNIKKWYIIEYVKNVSRETYKTDI